ncbi:MAG: hypothetical protein ACLSGS_02485 [Adlercreutzia sp.]
MKKALLLVIGHRAVCSHRERRLPGELPRDAQDRRARAAGRGLRAHAGAPPRSGVRGVPSGSAIRRAWHNVAHLLAGVHQHVLPVLEEPAETVDTRTARARTRAIHQRPILSQIGYFAAILVISVIGFLTMLLSGSMNTLFRRGLALAAVLAALSSMFVVATANRACCSACSSASSRSSTRRWLLKKHLAGLGARC